MNSKVAKFMSRAPRYTLRPQDNQYLRFARKDEHGHSYTTRFLDISQSGLAFICDIEHAPHISDLIKVEFPIGGGFETVAWWGRVVRVEEYSDIKWFSKKTDPVDISQLLVAITFHEMPPGHALTIRAALEKKFEEVSKEQQHKNLKALIEFLTSNFLRILFYGFCVCATVWLLYILSQPSPNYDPQKGAPWGERFPNMPLKPGKLERDK